MSVTNLSPFMMFVSPIDGSGGALKLAALAHMNHFESLIMNCKTTGAIPMTSCHEMV